MKIDSYGFAGSAYNMVVVIRDEKAFFETLKANPHMSAIIGGDEETRENFPGVYIAGIMSDAHRAYNAECLSSTQKPCEWADRIREALRQSASQLE